MYGVKSWPQLKNFNRGTYTGDYTGAQTAGKSSKIKALGGSEVNGFMLVVNVYTQ